MRADIRNDIHERLAAMVDHFCKGNKAAFGRETDILPGVLASIIGGRKSKPSFELLQKVLVRYPEVDAGWLVIGRGQMLAGPTRIELEIPEAIDDNTFHPSQEQWQEIVQLTSDKLFNDERLRNQSASLRALWQIDANAQTQVYKVVGKPDSARPYNGLLTERLNISVEEATELVRSGAIRSKLLGTVDRITDYLISERAVREFLGEPFTEDRFGSYL